MVSIIIVNYNTFQLTYNCIESIIKQVRNIDYEIIVVDNSSAGSDHLLLKEHFPFVKLVCSEKNLGFAAGNNLGLTMARGEEILLLNSDTLLTSNTVFTTSQFLAANRNVGVVTCRLEYPDGSIQHNCQPFPNGFKRLLEKSRLFKILSKRLRSEIMQGPYFDYRNTGFPDWVWGTYFHFRTEVLSCFPDSKLPEDYFMYVEDLQWGYIIRKAGWEIAYDPGSSVIHLLGKSNGDRDLNMLANRTDFIRRHYSALDRFLLWISGGV